MRAVLKLERIGDNQFALRRAKAQNKVDRSVREPSFEWHGQRAWVARLAGYDLVYGFRREFMRGQVDYSEANSTGSRGIFEYFPLPPGIYEVNEPMSWKYCRRYFCRVEGETIVEIDRLEVERCLTSIISE